MASYLINNKMIIPIMRRWFISFFALFFASCSAFAPQQLHSKDPLYPNSQLGSTTFTSSDPSSNGGGISIGFLGCGTIASAIATGMATQSAVPINSILVTRRSESKSKLLHEKFPSLITIQDDNQRIVDQCDYIFLTVLPEQTTSVLQSLTFSADQTLISLVSTASLDDLIADSTLDPSQLSKMICLPSVARHQGVCLHCFSSQDASTAATNIVLTQLFTAMGGVVTLDNEADLQACMMTTCTMGPLYGMMKYSRDWLLKATSHRLSKEEASFLVIQQIVGAVLDAADRVDEDGNSCATDPDRLEKLIEEQTPGGLNEQALVNYERLGGPQGQEKVMDAILSRIRGGSDGFVET